MTREDMDKLSDAKLFLAARKACKIYLDAKFDFEMECSSPFGYNEDNVGEAVRARYSTTYSVYSDLNMALAKRLTGGGYFDVYLFNKKWPNLKAFVAWLD